MFKNVTLFYYYFIFIIMHIFGHCCCVFFIHYNAFTVWFPVNLHWTQRWCRWESYASSVLWFPSPKNAEKPKLVQKFQFCFFLLTTFVFQCKSFLFQKSQYTQNIKDNTIFFIMGIFGHRSCVYLINYNLFIDGFPINMHRTQKPWNRRVWWFSST